MKRMNSTLDQLQLAFISRLKLIRISVPGHNLYEQGFIPYSVFDDDKENVLCKNCIAVSVNSTYCYAFILDPSVLIH